MIGALFHHYPAEFTKRLGAEPGPLRAFWRKFKAQPANRDLFDTHPFLRGMTSEESGYVVPLVIHEDAGPITKKQSASCVSWSSMLAKGVMYGSMHLDPGYTEAQAPPN